MHKRGAFISILNVCVCVFIKIQGQCYYITEISDNICKYPSSLFVHYHKMPPTNSVIGMWKKCVKL